MVIKGQPQCPLTDDWINKMWHMHTVRCYSALNKERNCDPCYNIDEPQGHYAQWNKPVK